MAAVGYFIGKKWFAWDEKVEDRRRVAIKMIGVLKQHLGAERMADTLESYAVGDYSDIGNRWVGRLSESAPPTGFYTGQT